MLASTGNNTSAQTSASGTAAFSNFLAGAAGSRNGSANSNFMGRSRTSLDQGLQERTLRRDRGASVNSVNGSQVSTSTGLAASNGTTHRHGFSVAGGPFDRHDFSTEDSRPGSAISSTSARSAADSDTEGSAVTPARAPHSAGAELPSRNRDPRPIATRTTSRDQGWRDRRDKDGDKDRDREREKFRVKDVMPGLGGLGRRRKDKGDR